MKSPTRLLTVRTMREAQYFAAPAAGRKAA